MAAPKLRTIEVIEQDHNGVCSYFTKEGSHIGHAKYDPRIPLISLSEVEREHIVAVIKSVGTLENASKVLGINLSTLWRKRRLYGLE